MKIIFGSDHAGFELKAFLIKELDSESNIIEDEGTHSAESVDYPDFAHAVSEAVAVNPDALGVLICGSANGVAITANKHQGIRCAICWNEEVAALARLHNDANIIALPARFISNMEALAILRSFLSNSFEGGRHKRRVDKIACR